MAVEGSSRRSLELSDNLDLVEHCPAAVAIFDLGMNYLAASRRYLNDYGLAASPVGRNHYEVFPELPNELKAVHQRALAGEVVTSDSPTLFRQGERVDWITWEVRPWRTHDGAIGGILLFTEMVTAKETARARDNAIFDQAAVGVVVVEAATNCFLQVNDRFANALGYAPCELIGWAWPTITHPDDRGNVGALAEAMKRGETYQIEKRFIRKDGTIWWGHVTVNPILLNGEVRDEVAFIIDINARKAAEAAEREANARFRNFFLANAAGMAQADAVTRRIIEVNASFAAMLGYTPDELVGRNWVSITHPDDVEPNLASEADQLRAPEPSTLEKRYLHKDGRTVWAEVHITPMWEPGMPPTAKLIIAHDVGARRAAQETVARNERRFRALIERSNDMLIELDAKGRVQFWSPSAAEPLGFTSAEMRGRAFVSTVSEDDSEQVEHTLAELRRTPSGSARLSWLQKTREGAMRRVEVTARNLLNDPDVRALVLNLRDQTHENRLELQLQQAQKLEGLGQLAGGVAHDFNNLLTVVLSCGRALAEDLPRGEANLEDVMQVLAAAERASGLTRQLLAFARKQVIDPTPLNLNDVVSGSRRMLERLLGEDVELVAKLEPAIGPVFADAGQLEQVLLNLAVNARDAMPRGGKLTISTRNVGDEWVRVSVSDSGTGMPPEVRAHLFEPFFTTKPEGKGTGLGLATVYGIVTQASGQLRVESEVGQGTTFDLDFPRSTRAPAPMVAVSEDGLRGTETLLVVEDEPQVRNVIVRVLRGAGYRVLPAESAREALDVLERAGSVDMVLTDVVMPENDGRWLTDELRARGVRSPVLYISGYTDDIICEHGVIDGVELLPKPFTPSSLQARVRRVLDQSARASTGS